MSKSSLNPFWQRMRYLMWLFVIVWTFIVVGMLIFGLWEIHRQTQELARAKARTYLDVDQALRVWAAQHGGVYVPTTVRTPPNLYLAQVAERDIATPAGVSLTLMNPAYILRQFGQEFGERTGVATRITSLKPINPINAPDDWERDALAQLDRGVTEVNTFTETNGAPVLRMMRPMITEETCLKCHAVQGYQVGDVRGGIAVALPLAPLRSQERETMVMISAGMMGLWALGLIGIYLSAKNIRVALNDQARAENALRESEERYRRLADAAFEGIVIHENGIVLQANHATCVMIDARDPVEWIGKPILDFVAPESRDLVLQNVRTGSTEPCEAIGLRQDGTRFNAELRGKPIPYEGRTARVTVLHDITERKRVEDQLRASESRYRIVADNTYDWEFWQDPNNQFVYTSPSCLRITGRAAEEFARDPDLLDKIIHPDDRARFHDHQRFVRQEQLPGEIEFRILCPDGSEHWIAHVCQPVFENGNYLGTRGSNRDITERKRADQELFKFKLSIERAAEAVLITDPQGKITYVNSAFEKIYEYTPAEAIGQTPLIIKSDLITDDQYQKIWARLANREVSGGEIINKTKTGRLITIDGSNSPIVDDAGNLIGFVGVHHDITERQRAEDEVRASQQLLIKTFVSLQDAVFIIDARDTIIRDCNPAAARIFGYTCAEMIGQPTECLHVDLTALEEFRAHLNAALEKHGVLRGFEFRMKRKDGIVIPTEHNVTPLNDETGNRIGWVSVVRDITDRKRVERALQQQNEFAMTVMNTMGQGLTVTDAESRFEFVNDAYAKMVGLPRAEILGKRPVDVTMAEDHAVLARARADRRAGKTTTYETRFRRPDGNVVYALITGVPRWIDGKVAGAIAVIADLTEQKKIEEQLIFLSTHDALTGVYNRAFFEAELLRLDRSRAFPVSILIADVDNMKSTNDTLGHPAGDELLQRAAAVLQSAFRASDILARIGGDEFALILQDTDDVTAEQILARIRENLIESNAVKPCNPLHLSLGIATTTKDNLTETFKLADTRMYEDKHTHKAKGEQ